MPVPGASISELVGAAGVQKGTGSWKKLTCLYTSREEFAE